MKIKKYSLIELVVSIIIIPIIISITTSLYFYTNKVSAFSIYNSKNYAEVSQTISQLNLDSNTSYKLEVEDKKIVFHNVDGVIEYYLKEDGLYRNNLKYANVQDIVIKNITTEDNLYPLYEVTFSFNIEFDNESNIMDLKTKLTFPMKNN